MIRLLRQGRDEDQILLWAQSLCPSGVGPAGDERPCCWTRR